MCGSYWYFFTWLFWIKFSERISKSILEICLTFYSIKEGYSLYVLCFHLNWFIIHRIRNNSNIILRQRYIYSINIHLIWPLYQGSPFRDIPIEPISFRNCSKECYRWKLYVHINNLILFIQMSIVAIWFDDISIRISEIKDILSFLSSTRIKVLSSIFHEY